MVKTEKYVYLILEYVSGGELYNSLEREGKFEENKARIIFSQIAEGVRYFHIKKVAHRDLKLENILIGDYEKPKISDFGLSNYMKDGEFLQTCCGSSNYAAPEVISNCRYSGNEADVWSLGVILFVIVSGFLPFDEPSLPLLYSKIKNGKYRTPYNLSSDLSSLISSCLKVNPIERISVHDILKHPWLNKFPLYYSPETKSQNPCLVNDRIFNYLLEKDAFAGLAHEKNNLKEKILKKKGFGLFITSYKLLLDSKEYDQNVLDVKGKVFNCNFQYKALVRPDDWQIGLSVNISSEEIIEILFPALVECELEWKIAEKFRIRVRSVSFSTSIKIPEKNNVVGPKKDLKFEIQLFKYNERPVLDFRIIFGHPLVFFDVFDRISSKFMRFT